MDHIPLEDDLYFRGVGKRFSVKELQELPNSNLPIAYLEFLSKNNGGTPNKQEFRVPICGVAVLVNLLCADVFGFRASEKPLEHSLSWFAYRCGKYVPEDWMIIGVVNRDDFLVLHRSVGSIGIVYWEQVMELLDKPSDSVVVIVAPTILAFLLMLEEFIDE
ncbi:MAG: SMI1/KNR4 family protein [Pirellula sp.]|jgi:hypothetical protein